MRVFELSGASIPESAWSDIVYPPPASVDRRKQNLIAAKKLLDEPYRDRRYSSVFNVLDYYKTLRLRVSTEYNTPNVSNAWLKMYELLSSFPLITASTRSVFSNAELPGSFLMAINHYTKTNGFAIQWMAASIVETDPGKNYLDDRYRLVTNYPDNWIMDGESRRGAPGFNNGDTTIVDNISDFRGKVMERTGGRGVDLYTSDIGIDVSENYGNQELIESRLLLGSVVAALRTMAPGGNMVLKTFTYFEPFTLSIFRVLSTLFTKFYVCKPLSSRPSNSEVYLVGCGLTAVLAYPVEAFTQRLRDFNHRPFLSPDYTYGDDAFMDGVVKSYVIFEAQIDILRQYVRLYERYRDDIPGLVSRWKKHKREMIHRYLSLTHIRPLNSGDRLNVSEVIMRR